jgi:hypothetical protein
VLQNQAQPNPTARHECKTWIPLILCTTQITVQNSTLERVEFLTFWIFNIQQLNLDWQKNSKPKVEKLIINFVSFCLEMNFWAQKREIGIKNICFLQIGLYEYVKKIVILR